MKKVKSLLLLSVIPSFFFLISCTQEQTQNQILEEVSSKMKQFLNEDEKLKSDVIQKLDFKKISENKASLDITLESSFMSIFSNTKARLNLEVKISNINKRIYKRKNEFEKNNATFLIDNINPSLDYKVEIIKINDKEVALTESESNNFHFQIKATKPAPKKKKKNQQITIHHLLKKVVNKNSQKIMIHPHKNNLNQIKTNHNKIKKHQALIIKDNLLFLIIFVFQLNKLIYLRMNILLLLQNIEPLIPKLYIKNFMIEPFLLNLE